MRCESPRCVKILERWDTDQRYIGSCRGLFDRGCHGGDEREVFNELCQVVEETIALYKKEGRPLPPPTSGKDHANNMLCMAW